MTVEIGFTEELINSQYAPLAALSAYYQQHHLLEPLTGVEIPMRKRDFYFGRQADPGPPEHFDGLSDPFRSQQHWRSYLWLDFDLSGLPCSQQAEESQRGYFSDKKTPQLKCPL